MALQSIQDLDTPVSSLLGSLETWQETIGHIESELYSSEIYQQVMVRLQAKLGELAGEAQNLIKNISREAIRLALQQLVSQQLDPGSPPTQSQESLRGQLSEPVAAPSPSITHRPERVEQRAVSQSRKTHQKITYQDRVQQRLLYLRHLGQSFQQLRTTQGISLDQMHALTRIPVHQLQFLEAGKINLLPEIVYVRGFIRKIGNALGLEGDRLAAAIPEVDPQEGLLPSWSKPSQPTLCLRPAHLYVGYTALIAGAVGGLAWVSHQATSPASAPSETMSTSPTAKSPRHLPLKQGQTRRAVAQSVSPPEVTQVPGR